MEKKITYVVKTKDFEFFTEEEIKKYRFQIIGFK